MSGPVVADVLEALRAVLPYAESRAEDMTECAEHLDEQVKPGVTVGFDVAQAEARDLADKAWQSVQHAQSVLADAVGPDTATEPTAEAQAEHLQHRLGGNEFACSQMKDGKACTQQHDGKFDRKSRPVFYFATGCAVVENFCPACRAYWHVAVARNCLIEVRRHQQMLVAEDERQARGGT